jgi:hypothetical protein
MHARFDHRQSVESMRGHVEIAAHSHEALHDVGLGLGQSFNLPLAPFRFAIRCHGR